MKFKLPELPDISELSRDEVKQLNRNLLIRFYAVVAIVSLIGFVFN